MKAVVGYLQDVRGELAKVEWPEKQEVVKLTTVVFLVSAIVGAYIGVLDYAFTKLLELMLAQG